MAVELREPPCQRKKEVLQDACVFKYRARGQLEHVETPVEWRQNSKRKVLKARLIDWLVRGGCLVNWSIDWWPCSWKKMIKTKQSFDKTMRLWTKKDKLMVLKLRFDVCKTQKRLTTSNLLICTAPDASGSLRELARKWTNSALQFVVSCENFPLKNSNFCHDKNLFQRKTHKHNSNDRKTCLLKWKTIKVRSVRRHPVEWWFIHWSESSDKVFAS